MSAIFFFKTDAVKTLPHHATCIYFLFTDEIPTLICQITIFFLFAVPIKRSTNRILFFFSSFALINTLLPFL